MNKLYEVIMNNGTYAIGFATHFDKKASVKNLLKGFNNPKVLGSIFYEPNYGESLLGYSNVREVFENVLCEAFKTYTLQVETWLHTPEGNRSIPIKVQYFIGLVQDICARKEYSSIYGTLGDFSKTVQGKEIEGIVKSTCARNDEIEVGNVLKDILVMLAMRTLINDTMATGSSNKPDDDKVIIIDNPKPAPEPNPEPKVIVIDNPKPLEPVVSGHEEDVHDISLGEEIFGKDFHKLFSDISPDAPDDILLDRFSILKHVDSNGYINAYFKIMVNSYALRCGDGSKDDVDDLLRLVRDKSMIDTTIKRLAMAAVSISEAIGINKFVIKLHLFILGVIYYKTQKYDDFVDLGIYLFRMLNNNNETIKQYTDTVKYMETFVNVTTKNVSKPVELPVANEDKPIINPPIKPRKSLYDDDSKSLYNDTRATLPPTPDNPNPYNKYVGPSFVVDYIRGLRKASGRNY